MSPSTRVLLAFTGILTFGGTAGTQSVAPIRGFTAQTSAAQRKAEETFRGVPKPENLREYMRAITEEPHHAGGPGSRRVAEYLLGKFKSWGLNASIESFEALMPYPTERLVELVAPERYELKLKEPPVDEDKDSADAGGLPTFNAYSADGDVTAELVYVNFGTPEDYEQLAKLGVDVKGKIAIARYGRGWRGIKPKVAAEHGAIGCIIYSDPHEDGYYQGDAYPHGPFRAPGMIQRGSVMDMPRYPGDPSTPNRPSKPGVDRLPMDKITTFAPIPVQPMSYRDAQKILERLGGAVAPESWRGSLPITYHVGPGPARVHMTLQMNYGQRRLINVVGKVTGTTAPDAWIVVGSHRDAWTFGASDSVSGHVSMMSVVRAMGAMMQSGWRPRRTVLFVSWDGEEQGLIGSTEWVEDLQTELRAKTAVYVNRDAGAGGANFSASAVHSLTPFVYDLARALKPEQSDKTLFDTWLDRARSEPAPLGGPFLKAPPVGPLGSGSDYTAFLDHVGIASLDFGLNGRGGDGTYHSTYDHPGWFKTFIDPQFTHSVLAARVTGVATLRLADAEILPFDYEAYGRQILEYVRDIEQQAAKTGPQDAMTVDFAGMKRAATNFMKAGAALRAHGDTLLSGSPSAQGLADINARLVMAERDLIEPAGLPDRPWYRHVIYAPGLYTGYGVKTIPGVREAVDSGSYARAREQARVVIRALERATGTLHAARRDGS